MVSTLRSVIARALLPLLFITGTASAQQGFERILVPTVANEPIAGAFGSQWVTEIAGRNAGPQTLRLFFPVCPLFGCVYAEIPPHSSFGSQFASSAHGAVVAVPEAEAAQMLLSVRARDLSRALNTWGTEIPVVRESEVRATPITLLNLPNGERFRTTIRMYDFGDEFVARDFVVTVFALDGNTPLAEFVVPSASLTTADGAHQGIRFAVAGNLQLPPSAPERLRVTIRTTQPTRFWAFASVTNNETQHITIVSPTRPVEP